MKTEILILEEILAKDIERQKENRGGRSGEILALHCFSKAFLEIYARLEALEKEKN